MPRGVAAHLVLNGYDEGLSTPLWTYSTKNNVLWVSHWDFNGSCYCSITVPILINTNYEGNVPNRGTLGPPCSQAQHPASLWNCVSGVGLNQISSSVNKALPCPWGQLHTGSRKRIPAMCLWLSSGLCSPDSLGWEALSCSCSRHCDYPPEP